jgi:hypothetical protein
MTRLASRFGAANVICRDRPLPVYFYRNVDIRLKPVMSFPHSSRFNVR